MEKQTKPILCDMKDCHLRGKYAYCISNSERYGYKRCMFYDTKVGRGEGISGNDTVRMFIEKQHLEDVLGE